MHLINSPGFYYSKQMADKKVTKDSSAQDTASSSDGGTDANASSGSSGTEVIVRTFAHGEDAVVPKDEKILSVEYDRSMSVTRVTSTRDYSKERNDKAREEAAGEGATPSYPQPAGAVPAPAVPPSTSFAWGSIDTTKVQNLEDLKQLPPPIAEQEAAGLPTQEEAAEEGLPPTAAKDETEEATEAQAEANKESADRANEPVSEKDTSEAKDSKDEK